MKNEEYMLAAVTEEHDLNVGWSEVHSRRWKNTTTKGTPQGMLELNPVHDIDEKITITNVSGAAAWATPWIMLSNVRDQVLPSSKRIQYQRFWRKESHSRSSRRMDQHGR